MAHVYQLTQGCRVAEEGTAKKQEMNDATCYRAEPCLASRMQAEAIDNNPLKSVNFVKSVKVRQLCRKSVFSGHRGGG